jgi:hypothetical protein
MSDSPLIAWGNGVKYIDPDQLLQRLNERARLLAERTAQPGLEQATTEGLRGQRVALLALIQELTEALNGR